MHMAAAHVCSRVHANACHYPQERQRQREEQLLEVRRQERLAQEAAADAVRPQPMQAEGRSPYLASFPWSSTTARCVSEAGSGAAPLLPGGPLSEVMTAHIFQCQVCSSTKSHLTSQQALTGWQLMNSPVNLSSLADLIRRCAASCSPIAPASACMRQAHPGRHRCAGCVMQCRSARPGLYAPSPAWATQMCRLRDAMAFCLQGKVPFVQHNVCRQGVCDGAATLSAGPPGSRGGHGSQRGRVVAGHPAGRPPAGGPGPAAWHQATRRQGGRAQQAGWGTDARALSSTSWHRPARSPVAPGLLLAAPCCAVPRGSACQTCLLSPCKCDKVHRDVWDLVRPKLCRGRLEQAVVIVSGEGWHLMTCQAAHAAGWGWGQHCLPSACKKPLLLQCMPAAEQRLSIYIASDGKQSRPADQYAPTANWAGFQPQSRIEQCD